MNKEFFKSKSLSVSILLALVMAMAEAPLWVIFFAIIILVWRWGIERSEWPQVSRKVTSILAVALSIQVYLQHRTLLGQEASNTFLIGLTALKVMDYQSRRDHRFLVLLGFMMLGMKAIFSVDLYWLIPSSVAFFGFWIALLPQQMNRRGWYLSKVFLLAAPLCLTLFFVFPRFILPWAAIRSEGLAISGFSERMDPGSIASLVQVDQLAFRARFRDTAMIQEDLYWRGLVLNEANGLTWERPSRQLSSGLVGKLASDRSIKYEVMLEPGLRGHLFLLNRPKAVHSQFLRISEYEALTFRAVHSEGKPVVYQGISDPGFVDSVPPDKNLAQTVSLPPRTEKWVNETLAKERTLSGRISALKELFKDTRYGYTLNPGPYLGEQALDEFLFERRLGFCEHFAGAYSTLARALGVPSRVVLGYHGGTYNSFGDFWRVSQRDAHAWSEIYIEGRWVSVDPTIWIAPLRIHLGAEQFFGLSQEERQRLEGEDGLRGRGEQVSFFEIIAFWIDDLNYRWTIFVLDFNVEEQREMISIMARELGPLLVVTVLLIILITLFFRRRTKKLKDPLLFLIDQVFQLGASLGLSRMPSDAPRAYIERLLVQLNEQEQALLKDILSIYECDRYAGEVATLEKTQALSKKLRVLSKEKRFLNRHGTNSLVDKS